MVRVTHLLNIRKSDLLKCRSQHESLLDCHKRIQGYLFECLKRPLPAEFDEDSSISAPAMPLTPAHSTHTPSPIPVSRKDYPKIKFWTQRDWTLHKSRDVSNPQQASGQRGGTRAANGENVTMKYVEDRDGNEIGISTAKSIKASARALWRGFYGSGIAPSKWGNATNEVRDIFFREMEKKFPVLRYCEDNWKVNYIATTLYSTWYPRYHENMVLYGSNPPPKKRVKTPGATRPTDRTLDKSPPPEEWDDSDTEEIESESSRFIQDDPSLSVLTQRPRPRPLRDSL